MNQIPTIVFVCEHGAAKSVVAAAYFNKLAAETNSNLRAIARGTDPDQELSPSAIAGLRDDGLTPTEADPRKLSLTDAASAQLIIAFCELPEEFRNKVAVEQWGGIPPVSEGYEKARDAISERLKRMMK